jgi:light-regulated signal transduction histidine kinase (bacteriophytochrome)
MAPVSGEDRAIEDARVRLAELNEFAANAGHDILGPLNQACSLLALFIKRYGGQLDSEADILLDYLLSSAARMEGVFIGVQKYLDLSSIAPCFEPTDLNKALKSALVSLESEIAESGAVITSDLLPQTVSADPKLIAFFFELLIGNSIRFCKPSEPPQIHVIAIQAERNLIITVEDNGIGIEPAFRETVFLPFKRLNGRAYPGPGLGLAMAKLIAGLHRGGLRIESASRGGTAVVFTMPSFTAPFDQA